MTESWTDGSYLRDVQYDGDANLAARQSIYAYRTDAFDLHGWVLDRLGLTGTETVVEVGCGNGHYLAELARRGHTGRVLGIDLSVAMLPAARAAAPAATLLAGDAVALPLRDGGADVVLAPHMLYHVPDPTRAIAEMARVVRPGGMVAVVLNGADHLAELRDVGAPNTAQLLDIDAGRRLLGACFGPVTVEEVTGLLVIPDAAPVEAYLRSIGIERRVTPPPGGWRVRTHTGVLLATSARLPPPSG